MVRAKLACTAPSHGKFNDVLNVEDVWEWCNHVYLLLKTDSESFTPSHGSQLLELRESSAESQAGPSRNLLQIPR